jgi:hypothetical protein
VRDVAPAADDDWSVTAQARQARSADRVEPIAKRRPKQPERRTG